MITIAAGPVTGTLPAPGATAYEGKLIATIIIAPDPTATGIVYVNHNTKHVVAFNIPAATGPLDKPFRINADESLDVLDPTEWSIAPAVAGEHAFVTYEVV